MIDWGLVLAYVVGMLTVFVPLAIGSAWRECRKRNEQQHELDLKRLEVQAELMKQVMVSGYEVEYDDVPDVGEMPRLKLRAPSAPKPDDGLPDREDVSPPSP